MNKMLHNIILSCASAHHELGKQFWRKMLMQSETSKVWTRCPGVAVSPALSAAHLP